MTMWSPDNPWQPKHRTENATVATIRSASVAQQEEPLICNQQVVGSSPTAGPHSPYSPTTGPFGYWTPEEDAWLHENYRTMGSVMCAEYLGRTKMAVRRRAHLLRKLPPKTQSQATVTEFQVDASGWDVDL